MSLFIYFITLRQMKWRAHHKGRLSQKKTVWIEEERNSRKFSKDVGLFTYSFVIRLRGEKSSSEAFSWKTTLTKSARCQSSEFSAIDRHYSQHGFESAWL